MGVRVSVPFVMDGKIHAHSFGNKLLVAEVPDKGGVLVGRYLSGMESTHLLASWEFHCFSIASAAFQRVLRSAYSGGAFAGSRISL